MQPSILPAIPAPVTETLRWRRWLAVHLALALALCAWLGLAMRPVALPAAAGERIACVSYSPFYGPRQSPLDVTSRVDQSQIRADLQALSALSGCVRIYAVSQGLEAVPAIARELGLKVLLGAWVGADPEINRRQLDAAIALANRHPDTVRALLVGNEVLLRGELAPSALATLLDEARARTRVPVSYADVWEFWMRHPQLLDSVDFATVHILPFWEDDPVAIEHAVEHVASIRAKVAAAFGKPVLIGETGWPSAGRQREQAVPGRVNQARFVRELLLRANREGWDYNLIEAIDQPWKRILEGTVGGHWGILDTSLGHKFELDGAVAERADWGWLPPLGVFGGLVCAALAARFRSGWRTAAFALVGVWAGLVAGLALEHAELAWRNPREWVVLGAACALGWGWIALAAYALGQRDGWSAALSRGRLAILFCAALAALWLAVDPRYRDFPLWIYAGVAPGLLLARRAGLRGGREERLCAAVIGLAGLARWVMEPGNQQAIAWLVLCAVLALAGGLPGEQQQRQQRAG